MSFRPWTTGMSAPPVLDQTIPFCDDRAEIKIQSLSDSGSNTDPSQHVDEEAFAIPIDAVVLEDPAANFVKVGEAGHKPRLSDLRTVGSFGLHDLDSSKALHHKGVRLDWDHLSISIDGQPVLSNLSGFVKPGELFAILGPSGCGKTTLLNALCNQLSAGNQVQTGQIFVDQASIDPVTFPKIAAYVRQSDVLIETLTPREAINFVADITKPDIDIKTRRNTTEKVLKILGLEACADRIIGGRNIKGISGGERKRASIAVELVTNPRLICLDEPTSALDSSTAESVVLSLRRLADDGRTIIASIHQPSHALFRLFDRVLLLSGGSTAYIGTPDDSILYFSRIGFILPPYTNPCEYFINLLSIHWNEDNSGNMEQARSRIERILSEASRQPNIHFPTRESNPIMPTHKSSERAHWFHQLRQTCKRNLINYIRQPKLLRLRVIKAISMGLLCGILFTNLGTDQKSVRNRGGAVFFIMLGNGMGSALDAVRLLPEEYPSVTKEFYHLYHPSAYFISKCITEMPFLTIQAILTASVSYPMIGFQSSWSKFGIFLCIMCLATYTCDALGIMIGSLFPNPQVAAASASIILMPLVVFSGFLVNDASIPAALRWIQYISPFKYALGALLINELDGLQLHCSDDEYLHLANNAAVCPLTTGQQALQAIYTLESSNLWTYIWANMVIYLIFRIIGLFFTIYNSQSHSKRGRRHRSHRRSH